MDFDKCIVSCIHNSGIRPSDKTNSFTAMAKIPCASPIQKLLPTTDLLTVSIVCLFQNVV